MESNYRIEGDSSVGIIYVTDAGRRKMRVNDRGQLYKDIEYLELCVRKREGAKWFQGMSENVVLCVEKDKCQSLIDHLKEAGDVVFPLHRRYDKEF